MLYLLYFSPTGGTERVCRLLAGAWEEEGRPVDLTRRDTDVSRLRLGAEDICLVAVPAFAGRVPQIAAQRLGQLTGGGAQAVPVAVFGNRAWEDTLLETRDLLLERGFRCPAAVAAVAEHSIFRQYGADRPDEEDQRQLAAFSQQLRQHLAQFPEGTVAVPGHHPYRAYGKPGLLPAVSAACTGCGRCAAGCPVGAISAGRPAAIDTGRCIGCLRCVSLCPAGACQTDAAAVAAAAQRMEPLFCERKENELFLA